MAERERDRNRMIARARLELSEDQVDDPAEKKQIKEARRISRLPAFLQDDCGDASEFPDVPYGIRMTEFSKRFKDLGMLNNPLPR